MSLGHHQYDLLPAANFATDRGIEWAWLYLAPSQLCLLCPLRDNSQSRSLWFAIVLSVPCGANNQRVNRPHINNLISGIRHKGLHEIPHTRPGPCPGASSPFTPTPQLPTRNDMAVPTISDSTPHSDSLDPRTSFKGEWRLERPAACVLTAKPDPYDQERARSLVLIN